MKKFLSLLLFFPTLSLAASLFGPGIIPNLQTAGRTFTDLSSNLITLYCEENQGSGRNCTFRTVNPNASASPVPYQVPSPLPSGATKGLVVNAVICTQVGSGANSIQLLYSTNNVGYISSSSFTGPGYAMGLSTAFECYLPGTVGAQCSFDPEFIVPSGDYLGLFGSNTISSDTICQALGTVQ